MKRKLLRMVIPVYPAVNIYSFMANKTSSLGPVSVATSARDLEGWDVEVIDENNFRRYGPRNKSGEIDHETLQRERPADVVGFYGGLTSTIPRLYEIAKFYKGKGAATIAGGQHFFGENIAEALTSGIDVLAFGEGEHTIKELLPAIMKKQDLGCIKGIAYMANGKITQTPKREPITDLDSLPLPDFSLVRYARIAVYPVERIRGCGMNCEFCTVKGKPRPASVERLLETIKRLVETRNASRFFVVDDLFGQQRDETIRFCSMLKDYQDKIGRKLHLAVQIRLDKARDPQLLFAMRQANINTVSIGYESPIKEELEAMNKHLKPEDLLSLTRVYRKFGFHVHGMFIFGYPVKEGTDFKMGARERVKRFRKFIKKARLDSVQVLLAVPLSGTELRSRLEKQNRIYPLEHVGWQYYDGNFPLIEPDEPMTAEEAQASIKKIMGRFYKFPNLFLIGLRIIFFPFLISAFFLRNIRTAWKRWLKSWRNNLIRFGGWTILRAWVSAFRKDTFPEKLQKARRHLDSSRTSIT